jgi:hypothetical protein
MWLLDGVLHQDLGMATRRGPELRTFMIDDVRHVVPAPDGTKTGPQNPIHEPRKIT